MMNRNLDSVKRIRNFGGVIPSIIIILIWKFQEEIKEEVENVCKLFPHTINEQCQDYIEAYGDQLIQLLVLQIDPATVSKILSFSTTRLYVIV